MDLFANNNTSNKFSPLAEKLRPKKLEEILGQNKVLGADSSLSNLINNDQVPSLILWGPPGCGKTTFARVFATHTKKEFIPLNAISTGAKELRELCQESKNRRNYHEIGTVLFIDEIHRLNKSQQDVLLPFVESGDVTLLGATTENPSFEVNSALLSRCRLIVFETLNRASLEAILLKALNYYTVELENLLDTNAKDALLLLPSGDARKLLNLIEQIIDYYKFDSTKFPLNTAELKTILGSVPLGHDKNGDKHYDTISVFIKSIRGSDANAGLYYLARMLEAGEDPKFIARRLVILASEDVGNADPRAISIAVAGFQAVELIGLPEAAINLAQVVTYLASAPKSNRSYLGLRKAQSVVQSTGVLDIPMSAKNAPTKMMKNLGYGEGYNYAHNGDKGWMPQEFLPKELRSEKFYEPKSIGFEKQIMEYDKWRKENK